MKTLSLIAILVFALPAFAQEKTVHHKDLVYAEVEGHKLLLDLHLPTDAKNPPLVIYIHGGSWRQGTHRDSPVRWLADEGYALASITYRFSNKAIFPAQIHDVKGAVRWLRANAKKFGYDTSKVGVVGSSAGGTLASLLATTGDVKELEGATGGNTDQSSRVTAVVDFYGPADFILRSKTQPASNKSDSSSYQLLGGPPSEKTDLAKLASAAWHVTPDDAPLLIIHGDADKTVLLDQSQRLRDAYRTANLEATLHVVPGAGHGGAVFQSAEHRKMVLDFLNKKLRP